MNGTDAFRMIIFLTVLTAVAICGLITVLRPGGVTRPLKQLWARHRAVDPEAGQATSEYVMWAGVLVAVIIALAAVLEAAGVSIIGRLTDVLG